jgi:molecular chaperone HtpG
MYDHALMAIREYVQNSADAIDEYHRTFGTVSRSDETIDISVDGKTRSVRIKDTGAGVPSAIAWHILHDLGRSSKDSSHNRGFRGIGRLGGLGYCDELKIETKAPGENVISSSTWDCNKLRRLISEGRSSEDAVSVIEEVTTFEQIPYQGAPSDHFFQVELLNVRSSRDILLDVPAIKRYLAQVAPVPFRTDSFTFAKTVDYQLRAAVPTYETYDIRVNGDPITKPYADDVRINGERCLQVNGIECFTLTDETENLAVGWVAQMDLSGAINPASLVDGLRVRRGNILVGDKHLLADFYRERRFSNYLVGEIHVVSNRLIPNSRRDDFEDNEARETFYSCFAKEIGIPYSKRIRDCSEYRSQTKRSFDLNIWLDKAQKVATYGHYSEGHKLDLLAMLQRLGANMQDNNYGDQIKVLAELVATSCHILDKRNGALSIEDKILWKRVFEMIYAGTSEKGEAELLLKRILQGPLSDIYGQPNRRVNPD